MAPMHSFELPDVGRAVGVGQACAESGAGLVRETASTLPMDRTVPAYTRQLVEFGQAYAAHAAQKYGSGVFDGTIAYDDTPSRAGDPCRVDIERPRATVSITAHVAFTDGRNDYTGPLVVTGTGCGTDRLGSMPPAWEAFGTDPLGDTLRCPRLRGTARWSFVWSAVVSGHECTLNDVPLPKVQLLLAGPYAPTADGSGTVTGEFWMNTIG